MAWAVREHVRELGKETDPCHASDDVLTECGEEAERAEGERGGVDGEEGEDVCFWYVGTLGAS